jgi:hypothetical protein
MFLKLMIFFWLWPGLLGAEVPEKELAGYDPKVDSISPKYEAGAYLIYDCVEGHFTCVLQSYFTECQRQRADDLMEKKSIRCAPLEKRPTKKSCFQKQLFLSSQNFGTRFCIGEEWKQKDLVN